MQYFKSLNDNPLNLYCSYIDLVRPIELKEMHDDLKEEIKE